MREIEVQGLIGLEQPAPPGPAGDPLPEVEVPQLQTSVGKVYPQTNDHVDTTLQLVGAWIIVLTCLLWFVKAIVQEE